MQGPFLEAQRKRRKKYQETRKTRRGLLPQPESRTCNVQERQSETTSFSQSGPNLTCKTVYDELVVLLGAKKLQERKDLEDWLRIIQNEVFDGNGPIIEDLSRGIKRLKKKRVSRAYEDFSRVIQHIHAEDHRQNLNSRMVVGKADVFKRCRLFAEIMSTCYTSNLEHGGPCFRQLEDLDTEEKEDIQFLIDQAIEESNTNLMKQCTYNIYEKCSNSPPCIINDMKEPVKHTVRIKSLPSYEEFAAHVQIGSLRTRRGSVPLYVFLWLDKSNNLCIRRKLSVFKIEPKHVLKFGGEQLTIKLKKEDGKDVCQFGYGTDFDYTADSPTSNPYVTREELQDSFRKGENISF